MKTVLYHNKAGGAFMELRDRNGLTEAEFLAQYQPGDYPSASFWNEAMVRTEGCVFHSC